MADNENTSKLPRHSDDYELLPRLTNVSSFSTLPETHGSGGEEKVIEDERPLKRGIWSLAKDWAVELLCVLSTLILLAAIIGILAHYDGASIPHWQYGITLNTLVSVFTTISTFTLLAPVSAAIGQLKWLRLTERSRALDEFCAIHDASRGFRGSLELLSRKKGGYVRAFN